ncbi:signal peptidase I [Rossellomorea vietnamensis]|uniref:Signal peptidase I n=1 Tax=Rossellomorea vietnamensis TaxID=218284 RepID=A0A5D4KBY0_9BACI|nr:signal peptidase I [Rossellomorea vietnamensis]TYR74379.1 signal peptidase I [Rossellomorea vietnamensis]
MEPFKSKELSSWFKTILITLAVVLVCRQFLFSPVTVKGESMNPTFDTNNKVFISKISEINRFDLIVFQSPNHGEEHIKRVIGLPRDIVEVKNDVLRVNGKEYIEPYLAANKEKVEQGQNLTEDLKVTVPEGSIYVMGDNREKSGDSRLYGFVALDAISGEVKVRYFPFNQFTVFS